MNEVLFLKHVHVLPVLFQVLSEEPLEEDHLILLDLRSFECVVITGPASVCNIHHRIAMAVENVVHHQPRNSPVPVAERVDRDKLEMDECCKFHWLEFPLMLSVPGEEFLQ